jgi:hypothetical protein
MHTHTHTYIHTLNSVDATRECCCEYKVEKEAILIKRTRRAYAVLIGSAVLVVQAVQCHSLKNNTQRIHKEETRSYTVVIIPDKALVKEGGGGRKRWEKGRRFQVAESSCKQMKLNAKVRGAMVTCFLIKL